MPTKEQATRYSLFGIAIVVLTLTLQAVTPLGSVLGIVSDRATQDTAVNAQLAAIEKSTAEIPELKTKVTQIEQQMAAFQKHAADDNLHMAESEKYQKFVSMPRYQADQSAARQLATQRDTNVDRQLSEIKEGMKEQSSLLRDISDRLPPR